MDTMSVADEESLFVSQKPIPAVLAANVVRQFRLSGVNDLIRLMLPDIEPRRSKAIVTQFTSLGN